MENNLIPESNKQKQPINFKFLNSFSLKIIAIFLMICDHLWSTVIPEQNWLTAIGRIAFPIFAFLLVEGFTKTSNFNKYLKRLFIFACISEIPFNLMVGGSPFYPFHQNVLFTFCIALICLQLIEQAKTKGTFIFILTVILVLFVGYIIGFITFVDYFGYGIWMVLLFYLTKDIPFGWIIQLIGMIYINCFMMGGLVFNIPFLDRIIEIPEQGLAVLALIPIWLYNGKHGPYSKELQYAFYGIYPLHMFILAVAAILISSSFH